MKNKRSNLKLAIFQSLDKGESKKDIFDRLVAQGFSPRVVATYLGSYPDRQRYRQHVKWVWLACVLVSVKALMSLFLTRVPLNEMTEAGYVVLMMELAVSLFFVYGFLKNRVFFFNFYVGFVILQLSRTTEFWDKLPDLNRWAALFNLCSLVVVWVVRSRLYPDLFLLSPRKKNGEFVFSA
jgi:hypothetical protein